MFVFLKPYISVNAQKFDYCGKEKLTGLRRGPKRLILFPDRLGVSNPTSREKLLAAVHELKLFGSSVPDERQFRLSVPGSKNGMVSPRTKRRSLPARPTNMQELLLKEMLSDSTEKGKLAPMPSSIYVGDAVA